MKKCCIVIPIYKHDLDCVEKISINRLWKVIGTKYDIYLVKPKSLFTEEYYNALPDTVAAAQHIKEVEFDDKYFKSTATYSQLCINYDFYNTFSDYEYMIIYQLDCYIFSDLIEFWCNKGYDYIGGPILSTDCGWDTVKKHQENENGKWTPYVGNGGFSLRKISTFKDITDPNGELRTYYKLTDKELEKIAWEDKYFCNDLYDFYKLNIPKWPEAMAFALDMSVDVVYNFFKWQGVPMAIHSVDKNIRWWKDHISEFSDPEVVAYCEEKHKDFFKLYYDKNNSTMR